MRIGIYGGSFNPVHFGHVGVARRAVDELHLDKLIVVPAAVSPFKTGEPPVGMPWDRVELVQAAFAALDRTVVDLREIRRGGVSYAIDTVREIARENPDAELHFIIGEDSREGLSHWKDIETLRSLCAFDAFPRTEESSSEIRRLFSSCGVVENPDAKLAHTVRAGIVRRQGFCPCRLARTPEYFCPCTEFRQQLADPSFHGLCHCRLYLKP